MKRTLDIGVCIEAPAWTRALPRASRLAERAARAAFMAARPARVPPAGAEAAVVLASDAQMRALNRDYRGRNKPTNVLAFAAQDWRVGARHAVRRASARHAIRRASARRARDADTPRAAAQPMALGDVVVALETARAEARAEGKPLADHLRHLVVHGMLHLLGHDHRRAPAARRMERLEAQVLATLDVPDPYANEPGGIRPARARRRRGSR